MLTTPLTKALVHGTSPADPATYVGVALGLVAVTMRATYRPARRAYGYSWPARALARAASTAIDTL